VCRAPKRSPRQKKKCTASLFFAVRSMQAHGKGLTPLMGIGRRQIFAVRLGWHTTKLSVFAVSFHMGTRQTFPMSCALF